MDIKEMLFLTNTI